MHTTRVFLFGREVAAGADGLTGRNFVTIAKPLSNEPGTDVSTVNYVFMVSGHVSGCAGRSGSTK